jgi:hypothetical protein
MTEHHRHRTEDELWNLTSGIRACTPIQIHEDEVWRVVDRQEERIRELSAREKVQETQQLIDSDLWLSHRDSCTQTGIKKVMAVGILIEIKSQS